MVDSKSQIIKQVKQFAESILINLPSELKYHSVDHTRDVVKATKEIAENSQVSEADSMIVEMAAWFHDLGYSKSVDNHEEASAEIALEFMSTIGIADEDAARVIGCIMATKMPQNPRNILEQILCDADLVHLAKENFCEKSELLQKELQELKGKEISDVDWYQGNIHFINEHSFFTKYAKNRFKEAVATNLQIVNERLDKMSEQKKDVQALEKEVEKLKKKLSKAKDKDNTPSRGIETMFRLTSKNHLDLSSMADTKANIMISVNSIILSVVVSLLFRKLEEYPHYTLPAILLTVVCLSTIVFAILATLPNVSKGTFTEEDIKNKKTNLLFFGNFHKMDLDKYQWGMKEMMHDADYLYTSLIKDIYYLGVVLGKKYKLLRVSYSIFMFGFVISILAFVIAEVFFKLPSPY